MSVTEISGVVTTVLAIYFPNTLKFLPIFQKKKLKLVEIKWFKVLQLFMVALWSKVISDGL